VWAWPCMPEAPTCCRGFVPSVIEALRGLISQMFDLVTKGWRNQECLETLRKVESELRELKSLLDLDVTDPKFLWMTVGRIRGLSGLIVLLHRPLPS